MCGSFFLLNLLYRSYFQRFRVQSYYFLPTYANGQCIFAAFSVILQGFALARIVSIEYAGIPTGESIVAIRAAAYT